MEIDTVSGVSHRHVVYIVLLHPSVQKSRTLSLTMAFKSENMGIDQYGPRTHRSCYALQTFHIIYFLAYYNVYKHQNIVFKSTIARVLLPMLDRCI